ncbi:MAG: glycosyltransferase, partial [Lachnospiraceae bacterium]|nr:glycosyltransferase [Lachnospiraceae bacterium]
MKKKILLCINTLGGAGAERAMLTMLRHIDPEKFDISLYVILGQGELISEVPEYVRILNKHYEPKSVLAEEGKLALKKTVIRAAFKKGNVIRLAPYLIKNLFIMLKKKSVKPDKLLWRLLSDSAERFDEEYDIAVAYLEGGATYYVADHIKAKTKVSFVHINYWMAGYSRELD